jgi:Spy/CpxP family protein refolding chaperone
MKKILITCVVLAAVLPLASQEFDLPPGKWWEDQRVVERIGLTDQQQTQIRDVVYGHARIMIDLKAAVDVAGLDLAATVDGGEFDARAVREAYTAFQAARNRLENERFEMLLGVRQVLSSEQWQRIQEMRRRAQQMRGQQRRPGQRPQGGERPPGSGL